MSGSDEDREWDRQANINFRRGHDLTREPDPDKVAHHLAGALAAEGYRPGRIEGNEKMVAIAFTKAELWEVICNLEASYESGIPENALADSVMDKLNTAYKRIS